MANAKGLSLRGGQRPTWQSRCSRLHRGKVTGEIATAFPRLPRRFAPRNDTSGGYCGAPAPSSGLIPLCKALNERRYRRNRSVRFYRHLVRTGSAFPRLPRAQSALAMTNRGPLPFYRYPIRIGGAAPGAACRSPTAHGRRSVYFSFFIFQSSVFISMRPSPTTHYRFLASGVDFSCASCSARMMRFETSQPRGVRYQREPLCAARPCPAKRSSSCCSGAKGSR